MLNCCSNRCFDLVSSSKWVVSCRITIHSNLSNYLQYVTFSTDGTVVLHGSYNDVCNTVICFHWQGRQRTAGEIPEGTWVTNLFSISFISLFMTRTQSTFFCNCTEYSLCNDWPFCPSQRQKEWSDRAVYSPWSRDAVSHYIVMLS